MITQEYVLRWLPVALLLTFLPACSSAGSSLVVPGTPAPADVTAIPIVSATSIPLPSSTPAPVLTALPEDMPGNKTTESNVVIPTSTIPAQHSGIQICSPLAIHPFEELPEIISDPYRPPPPGKEQRHHGVDFSYYRRGERSTIQGVGVQTVLAGVVVASLADTFPYGNLVIIETPLDSLPAEWVETLQLPPGESIYTLYAHMEEPPQVISGEGVGACQPLGTVGLSGNAAEPHLHIEMRGGPSGVRFSSMGFYKADDTEEERSNYTRWRTGGEFRHFDPMLLLSGEIIQ